MSVLELNNVDSKFIDWLAAHAIERRDNAAHGGLHHDGGCKNILEQIECFTAGRNNKFPEAWKTYRARFVKETDPDYARYLQLKRKFE